MAGAGTSNGVDLLAAGRLPGDVAAALKGSRVGLITNHAGVTKTLGSTVDLLFQADGIDLRALFGPEHGVRGNARAGEKVGDGVDPVTGLPVYSLYGENRKPTREMLAGIDVLVMDLQDIGCRYFTYIYTMALSMEAAATAGIGFVVLDRPNPINGITREGGILGEGFKSFVGLYPIPVRHGLTAGELALLFKQLLGMDLELTVAPVEGWRRGMWFDETGSIWVPPTPNSTCIEMATLYPGTCLVEGTNMSEGRGTTMPFRVVGAPWIEPHRFADHLARQGIEGALFRPTYFQPSYSKHQSDVCGGVQIHVTDREALRPVRLGLHLVRAALELYPHDFAFLPPSGVSRCFFDLLVGTDRVREELLAGPDVEAIASRWEEGLEGFSSQVEAILLYD